MNVDVAAYLAPHRLNVEDAARKLDAANRNPNGLHTTYAAAGHLIAAQAAYIDALTATLDAHTWTAECGELELLHLHGRLRTLDERLHA